MIQALLHRCENMFYSPVKLPSKCEINHKILPPEGQKPIIIRPYKYGHAQKEEIEKLVMEILRGVITRPIKKKDGGWRFCVDYHKLN